MNRVKIIATIGPRTSHEDALRALEKAGMDIARLNGAHADLNWHAQTIELLRSVLPQVPILLDLPGRKIRTGKMDRELTFSQGEEVVFAPEGLRGGDLHVPVAFARWPAGVEAGGALLVDDGTLRFTIRGVLDSKVVCCAENGGTIRGGKGIHVPGNRREPSSLTDQDRRLLEFAQTKRVDFVGVSFIDHEQQVEAVRKELGGAPPRIIAKIETQGGIDRLPGIIRVSDGLMIDRGDLSVETNPERITLLQKQVLSEARLASCPVIVATEMLNSMIESPTPTKAEISDITHAVLDGAAALMLSGETTVGKYPVEAVAFMRRISDAASEHQQESLDAENGQKAENVPRAIAEAIALLCRNLPIAKIVAVTLSGFAARMIAACMPRQPILAVSNDPAAARSFNLLRGTKGIHVEMPVSRRSMEHIPLVLESLWRQKALSDEDLILVTAVSYPKSGNRMNLIETHLVADLRDSLGWRK